jgi:hypothetical protein
MTYPKRSLDVLGTERTYALAQALCVAKTSQNTVRKEHSLTR